MDYCKYLNQFRNAENLLNKNQLYEKQLQVDVGLIMDSVYLKLYKKHWSNNVENPTNAQSRIFFSIWLNDKTIKEQKLYYNIHALKMRHLKSYPIPSKVFAEHFRTAFKEFEHNWKNVSTKFGPLTLMEGWIKLNIDTLENNVTNLANNFMSIDYLIDKTLAVFEANK